MLGLNAISIIQRVNTFVSSAQAPKAPKAESGCHFRGHVSHPNARHSRHTDHEFEKESLLYDSWNDIIPPIYR